VLQCPDADDGIEFKTFEVALNRTIEHETVNLTIGIKAELANYTEASGLDVKQDLILRKTCDIGSPVKIKVE